MKFLVHIADAPPYLMLIFIIIRHGTRYNNCKNDEYPDGSLKGTDIEDIFKLMNKRNINYILISIGNELAKMISDFEKFIKNMKVSSITNAA